MRAIGPIYTRSIAVAPFAVVLDQPMHDRDRNEHSQLWQDAA